MSSALLRLFAPSREYLPTPKEFSRRIAAIICFGIDFLVKQRNERLKSLNIFTCVQIGMRIKFQSELCKFDRVGGNLKFHGID